MIKSRRSTASRPEALYWFERTVIEAGWHLPDPSPECREALVVPSVLQSAPYWDRVGVHTSILSFKLLLQFWRGKRPCPERGRALGLYALYLLAQNEMDGRRDVTPSELQIKHDKLRQWHERRYLPALRRLRAASTAEVEADPFAFTPAISYAVLQAELPCMDVDQHRMSLELGWAMHTEGNLHPEERTAFTDARLDGVFDLLRNSRNTCYIDSLGQIRMVPLWVKSAADKLLGKVRPSKDLELGNAAIVENNSTHGSLEPMLAADALGAVRRLAEVRLGRVARLSPEGVVWSGVLDAVERGEGSLPTVRALSDRSGLRRSTIGRARQQAMDDLASTLGEDS